MIALGSDHGGFALKEDIKSHLEENGYKVLDCGVYDTSSVDYPDIAEKVADEVTSGNCDCGILVCGTGIGISIAANKIKGVRCAVCGDTYSAKMAKAHNNANIIALGGRVLGSGLAADIVDAYLNASFLGGRHQTRVDKISRLEE